jgi:hypothetical protein
MYMWRENNILIGSDHPVTLRPRVYGTKFESLTQAFDYEKAHGFHEISL